MESTDKFPPGTTTDVVASTELHNGTTIRTTTTFDFGGCTLDEVLQWASSNRIIALQRAIRPLNTEVARDHANSTVMAKTAGHKPIDVDELIEQLPPEVLQRIIDQHKEE